MPQSLARILIHLIFSTKHRQSLISTQIAPTLHEYLGGILKQVGCVPIKIGGAEDHVHIVLCLARTITVADLVKTLKTGSSSWAKTKSSNDFAWQAGYGVFSVSESNLDDVVEYVSKQGEHHRRRSFMEEYRAFLVRHGITFDEQYVWD